MTPEIARQWAAQVAWSHLGTFYTWGGDDPSGFDCSGLVVEILKSVGLLPRGSDYTAAMLDQRYRAYVVAEPGLGCLAFYGKPGPATHVEFVLNDRLAVGASGGGRKVRTRQDAIDANAFIKIRPIRAGATFADPFRELFS